MNPSSTLRRLGAGLLMASLLLAQTACQNLIPSEHPLKTESLPSPDASPDNPEESLRAYYEALIFDLRQSLLSARQSNYLTRREYEDRISELESKLSAMEAPSDEPQGGTDVWVSGTPTQPPTEDPSPSLSFYYTVEDGTAVIYAYQGTATRATIPPTISDIPVTRIADNAFRSAPLVSVVIPDTVTEIGWFAFANCQHLQSITIPASVTVIHYGAFDNCPNLTIHCPENSYAAQFAAAFALQAEYEEN